ncbi:MAG: hypothetical protein HY812_05005 [Planctomycetes bacterium]|nr:hypothetical protein [Planctomycetota bacterium]
MARDSNRRNKALARKRRCREERKSKLHAAERSRAAECSAKHAGRWPVAVSKVNAGWRDARLATVAVARERPDHLFLLGVFLVDLGCLGVKNAVFDPALPDSKVRAFIGALAPGDRMTDCSPELAAKIVAAGVSYAEGLGFRPHQDFASARVALAGIDPAACTDDIACGGEDGKPLFVAGPDDDVEAVMEQLERTLGPDGFHYIIVNPEATMPE